MDYNFNEVADKLNQLFGEYLDASQRGEQQRAGQIAPILNVETINAVLQILSYLGQVQAEATRGD